MPNQERLGIFRSLIPRISRRTSSGPSRGSGRMKPPPRRRAARPAPGLAVVETGTEMPCAPASSVSRSVRAWTSGTISLIRSSKMKCTVSKPTISRNRSICCLRLSGIVM